MKTLTRIIWKYKRYSCIFVSSFKTKTNQNEKNHFQRMDIHTFTFGFFVRMFPIYEFQ